MKNIFFIFCSILTINTAFGMQESTEITFVNKTSSPVTINFGWIFYREEDRLDTFTYCLECKEKYTFNFAHINFADYPHVRIASSRRSIKLPIPGEKNLPFGETLTITNTNQTPAATNQAGKTIGQLILNEKKRHQ